MAALLTATSNLMIVASVIPLLIGMYTAHFKWVIVSIACTLAGGVLAFAKSVWHQQGPTRVEPPETGPGS